MHKHQPRSLKIKIKKNERNENYQRGKYFYSNFKMNNTFVL